MEKIEQVKTTFGLGQIGNSTPKWAKWIFRIVLYLCSGSILAITTLNVGRLGMNSEDIKDTVALLSFITVAVHALSRMVGVEIKQEDYQIK